MSRRIARPASSVGFTLSELLVALVIVLVVVAGVLRLAAEAQAFFRVQPETADVTQRARVGVDVLTRALAGAGAGPSLGEDASPLVRWLPPVLPYRYQGGGDDDPPGRVFTDRVTLIAVAEDAPYVPVRGAMRAADDAIPIAAGPGCPVGDAACGFRDGQRLAIVDRTVSFELATARAPWPGEVPHTPAALTKRYRQEDEARVAQVWTTTLVYDAGRRQVRRITEPGAVGPVLDEVVGLSFTYFGDRAPPRGPRPPPGGANCLFDERGVSRLETWAADDGEQAELTEGRLSDGPWCGVGGSRFDADLYRIRRVRVTLRVQAAGLWARGRDPRLFVRPGSGTDPRLLVPDVALVFDVSPRNLQAG